MDKFLPGVKSNRYFTEGTRKLRKYDSVILKNANLSGERPPKYIIFAQQSKSEDGRFVPLDVAWRSVLSMLKYDYYGSQVYVKSESPGPSTAQFVYPCDWHFVVNTLWQCVNHLMSRFLMMQKNLISPVCPDPREKEKLNFDFFDPSSLTTILYLPVRWILLLLNVLLNVPEISFSCAKQDAI